MKRSEALAILVGTQIGAGVLGLPYAAKNLGLIPSIAMLVGVMILMLFTARIVLEFSASMNGAQMSLMAEKTLGKAGGVLMFLSVLVMSFGALLAYISGMGRVFHDLFGISPVLGALIFWGFASAIIYLGIEASGKSELIMSMIMLVLFIGVAPLLLPHAKLGNAVKMDFNGLFTFVGVSIFALGCHTVVPEVYKGLGDKELTKKVLTWAFLIPTVIYITFMASFVLAFGDSTPQLATQALKTLYGNAGKIIGNLIPFFAITTSYIGLGLAQLSNFEEYLKMSRKTAWILTVVPPLAVYLAGVNDFVNVLGVAGDTGDLTAFIVLPIAMYIAHRIKSLNASKAVSPP
ncbi:aromatic amino acid transport family protein [Thermococcus barophilus]|uniref:Aromatic amino acid permease n=1 Tax=Thermococcus barophilus TaxID=55802 RepID=A0A0S1XEK5_THEBA|nr:aromatic amino acid transport family protein [Thermococcus barophilus]ALM76096.1 Aromatic amino acid permease [Thermococcus barophilus]